MLRLRPYKRADADTIVTWLSDEKTFKLWGGDRFGAFPLTAKLMNEKYFDNNGDCAEPDNFYPMTAFDEAGVCGHFIMRYTGGDSEILRFGWVVVDDSRRGRGYGREMLTLGLSFAFDILKVKSVTIGVFENNLPAYRCYKAVGFKENGDAPEIYEDIFGESVRIAELIVTKEDNSRGE